MPKAKKLTEAESGSPLRLSTIIQQNGVGEMEAAAVMRANGLKLSDRMEPERFLGMVEDWRRSPVRGN